jgi:hypothetical protein
MSTPLDPRCVAVPGVVSKAGRSIVRIFTISLDEQV